MPLPRSLQHLKGEGDSLDFRGACGEGHRWLLGACASCSRANGWPGTTRERQAAGASSQGSLLLIFLLTDSLYCYSSVVSRQFKSFFGGTFGSRLMRI